MDATIKVVYDNPSWPGCISLKDLKCLHPAGIFRDKFFYFLSDCGTIGFHELRFQYPDGGDKILMFYVEAGYAEIELLGEDEKLELKEIAFEIKKNFEKVFDDIYLYDYVNHTHTEEWKAKYL